MYVLYMYVQYYHYALTKSQTHERAHSVVKRQNCVPKSVMSAKMWQQTDGSQVAILTQKLHVLAHKDMGIAWYVYVTTCTMP